MSIDESSAGTDCAGFSGPLRASIYGLLETVLALSEEVAEMPLCPEQIELVYHVRDAARELSRLLNGPARAPVAAGPPGTPPLRNNPAQPPTPVGTDPQPCRILLVAGSHYLVAAMKRYLAGLPHYLDIADTSEALALFRRERYDLALLEASAGGIAVVETAREMRAWERERNLPRTPLVKLVSRHDPAGEPENEFDECLPSPLSRAALLRAVQRYGRAAWSGGSLFSPAVVGLAQAFLGKAENGLKEARGAVQRLDSAPVAELAEVLAGGGSVLGFQVLAMLGRRLLPASRHDDWPKIGRCLDEIEQCLGAGSLPVEWPAPDASAAGGRPRMARPPRGGTAPSAARMRRLGR
jgi:hypothetical protein